MKVSIHAAKRFLQRIFKKERYSKAELFRAKALLEKEVGTIVVIGKKRMIPLPSFPQARAVFTDNTIVTILTK